MTWLFLVSLIFINMQNTIFIYDYWMIYLSNCITDDLITCNKDSLGQNSVYICSYFLKSSLILINIQIR